MSRRKVLLLNPPGEKLYARDKYCTSVSKTSYYWPQVDLLVLSGYLKDHHDLVVLDAIAERISFEESFQRIEASGADTVIFLTCSASWDKDFTFVKRLKEELGMTTIANGGFLLFKGVSAMEQFPQIDAVMLDFTEPYILDYLRGDFEKLRGFIFRDNGKIVRRERDQQKRFSYPVPRHDLFPLKSYLFPLSKHRVYTAALTSMGCPFHCTFCIPATLPFKLRDVDNIIEELKVIQSLGIKEILFQDSSFGANRDHLRELCKKMIEENLNLTWMCQSRVDIIDEERIDLMKRAGCHSIQFGVESGDERILQTMSKGITLDQTRRAFALCRQHKITTNGFFIIGMPGETEETVLKTIAFAKELNCDVAAFSLPMPHPGTKLGEAVRSNGTVLTEWDLFDDVSHPNVPTGELTIEKIWELRNRAYREFYFRPSYILRRAMRITSRKELMMHLRAFMSIFRRVVLRDYEK
ncbi:MAG: radical SAM protein [Candidatus Coatesbacteria bacterium]|nr:radical SAM protein [Candidatus Coatesbacteria bacterium]